MYMPAISILLIGIFLLVMNIILFLGDYKETVAYPQRRKKLYFNGGVALSTIAMIVLGIIYIFVINNQL